MSWKSFVSAGLLCVVASPAFAVPTVDAVGGGSVSNNHLNASGQWVWQFRIAPTNPLPTGSTPLAAELGFSVDKPNSTSDDIVSAATKDAAIWDTDNPGTQIPIFGWETLTDVDPGPGTNNRPVGVQTNTTTDQVFSALGSVVLTTTGPKNYVAITVSRPVTPNASTLAITEIDVLGAYSGNGRVAELTGATTSANYDVYGGSVRRQAKGGDTNLDGTISVADYSTLIANYNQNAGTRQWNHGDFNGDSSVTVADYSQLIANFGAANNYSVLVDGAIPGGGGGAGASAAPEPASVALLALAALGLAGLRFRRR
jgi:hypothetical protein